LGYLFNIVESPKCTCEEGDQSVDNILFDWKLLEHDRVRLKGSGDMVRKMASGKRKT
jgi:hypothetical protein